MEGPAPVVSTHGNVDARDSAYAAEKVKAIFKSAPRPIHYAGIRLDQLGNPAIQRPAIAEATLEMKRRTLRAHVAAPTMREAVDLLEARLRRQMADLGERQTALRRKSNGERPATRPTFVERPMEDREVVRRKAFSMEPMTPDEAVFDMETLDHDFYLFTNADTREDNLVWRRADGSFVLVQLRAYDLALENTVAAIDVDETMPPELHLQEAIELIDVEKDDFVFFLDRESSRGHVLYRRFDGNYGLIVPSDEGGSEAAG